MVSPIKLYKSYEIANQVQKIVEGMTMKNWITGLHGIVIAGLMLAKIWAPATAQEKINDTVMALTATGFFAAKDFNQHSTVSETQNATVKENEKAIKSVNS